MNDFLTLASPAKINLSLRIGDRLPSGFHQIVTTIAPISLCDLVQLRLSNQGQSSCQVILGEGIADSLSLSSLNSLSKNIAAQAAACVLEDKAFELIIEKNIPTEAGLGGGSGNAATTLLLANQLREKPLSQSELLEIALKLGSDVGPMIFRAPVVQSGSTVELSSIPEEIRDMELLLVKPPSGSSTKEAYLRLNRPEVDPEEPDFNPTFAIENDFEEVFFLETWFQEGSQWLLELNAQRVLLCGSGSTLVGFFDPGSLDDSEIKEARKKLTNWWVYQTRFWS